MRGEHCSSKAITNAITEVCKLTSAHMIFFKLFASFKSWEINLYFFYVLVWLTIKNLTKANCRKCNFESCQKLLKLLSYFVKSVSSLLLKHLRHCVWREFFLNHFQSKDNFHWTAISPTGNQLLNNWSVNPARFFNIVGFLHASGMALEIAILIRN